MTQYRITPLNGRHYDTADLALDQLYHASAQALLRAFPRWVEQGQLCISIEHATPEAHAEFEIERQRLTAQGEWYRLPARTQQI